MMFSRDFGQKVISRGNATGVIYLLMGSADDWPAFVLVTNNNV
jgi:hypothetical protein